MASLPVDSQNIATENNLRFFLNGLAQYKNNFNATEEGLILNNFRSLQNQIIRGIPVKTVLINGIANTINDLKKLQLKTPDMREYQMAVMKADNDDHQIYFFEILYQ
jgi:hypothetical protein